MNLKNWLVLIFNDLRDSHRSPLIPPYEPQKTRFIINDLRNFTPHPGPLPVEGRGRIMRRFLAMLRDSIWFKGSMREFSFGEISPL
jgi:hypothetical protein